MKRSASTQFKENPSREAASRPVTAAELPVSFVDHRPEAVAQCELAQTINQSPRMVAQRALNEMIQNSPRVVAQRELEQRINQSPRMVAQRAQMARLFGTEAAQLQTSEDVLSLQGKGMPVQRMGKLEEEEPLQRKTGALQKKGEEEEELLQGKFAESAAPAQLVEDSAPPQNKTGLPDHLKSSIESLSGLAMDDVRVHYNSSKPSQLQAHAYAQGTDIHVAPGREQHLPHEAWHVVQQKQGRVRPTMQMKGVGINNDLGLEKEADVMGDRALEYKAATVQTKQERRQVSGKNNGGLSFSPSTLTPIQCALPPDENGYGGGEPDTRNWYNATPSSKLRKFETTDERPSFGKRFKIEFLKYKQAYTDSKGLSWLLTEYGTLLALPGIAIQIDHKFPWEHLKQYLLKESPPLNFVQKGLAVQDWMGQRRYSLYAARMYYHDVDNLQVMASSENAGKGETIGKWGDRIDKVRDEVAYLCKESAAYNSHLIDAAHQADFEWGQDPDEGKQIIINMEKVIDGTKLVTDQLYGL